MKRTVRTALPALVPNATKHGAFSKIAFLPDEDRLEFQRLHAGLVDYFSPRGPLEEDIVFSIARYMLRKQRVQAYIANSIATRLPDRGSMVRSAHGALELNPDDVARALSMSPEDMRKSIEKKCPRGDYETESAWKDAVSAELGLRLRGELKPADGDLVSTELEPDPPMVRRYRASDGELVECELAADERLDAMIDKLLKRLMQLKAMRELLGSSVAVDGPQPERM